MLRRHHILVILIVIHLDHDSFVNLSTNVSYFGSSNRGAPPFLVFRIEVNRLDGIAVMPLQHCFEFPGH